MIPPCIRDETVRPTGLRCKLQAEPLILPSLTPRLSWVPARKSVASDARIEVRGAGVSAWLKTDLPNCVWPGSHLGWGQRVAWRVQSRDSEWSEWAHFETGPDLSRWTGDWLGADLPAAPLFRCRFQLRQPVAEVERARWYWAALGVAELCLNGQCQSSPGMASYQNDSRYRCEVWALALDAGALVAGENALTVHLGGGFHETHRWGRRAFTGRCVIHYRDGSVQEIGAAAADWEVTPGPVRRDDVYDGECHDARLGPAEWLPVTVRPAPAGKLVAGRCPLPGPAGETLPVRVVTVHESCRVVDFGRNISGAMRLEATARRGRVFTLRYAEELDANGHLLVRGNRLALNTDRYVCGSAEPFRWLPSFAARGFRACEVSHHGDWPADIRFVGVDLHDRVAARAEFACSHAGLTELFAMCGRTFRQNLVGMLRDCPQRDERLGWLGDAHVVGPAVLATLDADAQFRRWLEEIAVTQHPVTHARWAAIAPAEPLHVQQYRSQLPPEADALAQADNGYTAAATLLPWQLYQATGDASVLTDHFTGIHRHLATWPRRADWPLVNASSHGDHAAIPVTPDGPATAKALVSAATLLMELHAAVAMAGVLGREVERVELAGWAETLAAALTKEYGARFMNAGSSQGTLALGLDLGLCPDAARGRAALRERLTRDGWRIATGVVLTRNLLRVLGAEAWPLVTRPESPGWLWMLAAGPGTLHENLVDRWAFVSRNQPALGVVAEWLLRSVLGVTPDTEDGICRSYTVAPPSIPELTWAAGCVPTPFGAITVRWERGQKVKVDAPATLQVRVAQEKTR